MKTWRPPAGQDAQILSGKSPKAISKAMKHGPHSKNPGTLYKPMPFIKAPVSNPFTYTGPSKGPMSLTSNPITGKLPVTGTAIAVKKK